MFFSILFPSEAQASHPRRSSIPACFADLKLDQVIKPGNLDSYYYTPLDDLETITYRQESMKELEDNNVRWWIRSFADEIVLLNSDINSLNWRYDLLSRGRLLDLCERYISAISTLSRFVEKVQFTSKGLSRFAACLHAYCTEGKYLGLCAAACQTRKSFSSLKYCLVLNKCSIGVKKHENEADLSTQVQTLFKKFQQGKSQGYRKQISEDPCSESAESEVLEALSKDCPEAYSNLDRFCSEYADFIDPVLLRFAEEVQFPISWLDLTDNLRENGLEFCYPSLECQPHSIRISGFFDIALAIKPKIRVVTNDLFMTAPERIMVITGPNQGGKTTFSRAFGQIHYLASLGICVPGSQASLVLADQVLTHFGREEDISELCGNLQNDLVWLHNGHGKSVLEKFYEELSEEQRASIKVVTGDGARWITDCVKQYTPDCVRCMDSFHVVEWAMTALDDVRKESWHDANDIVKAIEKGYKASRGRPRADDREAKKLKKAKDCASAVKGSSFAVGKAPEHLTKNQQTTLEGIRKSNSRLYRAYEMKETLRLILKSDNVDEAENALKSWFYWATHSRIDAFKELAKKVKRNMPFILNTIRIGLSNARIESTNNRIKLIIKRSFGFRNLDSMFSMIYLVCSDLIIPLPNRPNPLSNVA